MLPSVQIMETFGTNPMLLEEANESTSQRAPLVLIHDSSGLVFHYLQLQQFDRAMYGIYDPHFFNEKEWEGGLSELATNYCGLLRQEIPRGKIILGGWSLGGIIALEMAYILQFASDFDVVGIIMLDSVNPKISPEIDDTIPYAPKYDNHTSNTTIRHIEGAMQRTEKLLDSWCMPDWQGLPRSGDSMSGKRQPRTILLKATQWVPIEHPARICSIDIARHQKCLGWEDYDVDLVEAVLDIPGNHYSIFAADNINQLSCQISMAVDLLENQRPTPASRESSTEPLADSV